jgi:hypothetical protein
MSNWNQLETTLRSWTPRAPSPKLKARLFGATETAAAGVPGSVNAAAADEPPFSWQWFAPSMALVLIATFLLGHQSGVLGLSSVTSPGLIATAALGQPDLSTYYIAARHSENNMPVVGVEGTNRSFAMSGAPTNQLMH